MIELDEKLAKAALIARALTLHHDEDVKRAAAEILRLLQSYREEEEALNLLS